MRTWYDITKQVGALMTKLTGCATPGFKLVYLAMSKNAQFQSNYHTTKKRNFAKHIQLLADL